MEKRIFGTRLVSARKQAGLSQDGLVERIGSMVKKTAIAKYERGEMVPRPNVIEVLAKALDQPVDFFFKPVEVDVENIEFRAKASLGKRKKEMLKELIATRIEHYLELERLLNVNESFVNPLKDMIISSGNDVELAAEKLHEVWKLGSNPIGSVMGLLEDVGFKVIEIEADNDFEGYSATVNEQIPVIVVRENTSVERKRFTALHEAGHITMNFDPKLGKSDVEKLCHRFAGAMLIPRRVFYRHFGSTRTSFSTYEMGLIKDKYGISAGAFVMRASALEVIAKHRMVHLFQKIRKDPFELHIGSNNSTDDSTRFGQLLMRALTEGNISHTKAAELTGLPYKDFINQYLKNE
jgi:Zn-dependent peptidase ImmA (M78 family)/DNA-binding XRE family transcriptional regulator